MEERTFIKDLKTKEEMEKARKIIDRIIINKQNEYKLIEESILKPIKEIIKLAKDTRASHYPIEELEKRFIEQNIYLKKLLRVGK